MGRRVIVGIFVARDHLDPGVGLVRGEEKICKIFSSKFGQQHFLSRIASLDHLHIASAHQKPLEIHLKDILHISKRTYELEEHKTIRSKVHNSHALLIHL